MTAGEVPASRAYDRGAVDEEKMTLETSGAPRIPTTRRTNQLVLRNLFRVTTAFPATESRSLAFINPIGGDNSSGNMRMLSG